MSNEPSKIVQTFAEEKNNMSLKIIQTNWHFVTPVDNENIAPAVQQKLALVQTKEYIYYLL